MKSDLARFAHRLVYIFFVPVKKYMKKKKKQTNEGQVSSGVQFEVHCMSTRKECEWPASHVASVVRKQQDREAMLGLLVFSLSFTEGPLSREQIVLPTIRVCPTSFKPPWILPHRYVQKFVSKVILNVIKLATKTKQVQVTGRWKDGSAVERASCFWSTLGSHRPHRKDMHAGACAHPNPHN